MGKNKVSGQLDKKIECRNILFPSAWKIWFAKLTLMDLSFEASKIKLVEWASEVGFRRKKY